MDGEEVKLSSQQTPAADKAEGTAVDGYTVVVVSLLYESNSLRLFLSLSYLMQGDVRH